MAATTTPKISLLINKISQDYSDIKFIESDDFSWKPTEKIVYYDPAGDESLFLHELGHVELHHATYRRDIELLAIERDAWEQAKRLSKRYGITIEDESVESHLDSYRDWLHARSTCPNCQANGIQTDDKTYTCLECETSWRVNEARTCRLRRDSNQK